MPRINYEAGEEGGLDSPETYQPIRNPKIIGPKRPHHVGSRQPTKPRARPGKQENIYSVMRGLAAAQCQVFARAVAKTLGDPDPSVSIANLAELGVPVLGNGQAQWIFRKHFAPGNDIHGAASNFNRVVSRYVGRSNRQRPIVSAQLGELGIFGKRRPNEPGERFIGVSLAGQGVTDIIDENSGLMKALDAAKFSVSPIRERYYNSKPHVVLARTYSYPAAEALIARFDGEGLVEMVRDQLYGTDCPDVGNHEGLATFGRAVTDLIPIRVQR